MRLSDDDRRHVEEMTDKYREDIESTPLNLTAMALAMAEWDEEHDES